MPKFKITLEYNGTRYSGWQIQKNAQTIQGELLKAGESIFGTKTFELYGSSRTDAGVHALGQVAHLQVETQIPLEKLVVKFNDKLPHDITILELEKAHSKFHARFDAVARSYIYLISKRKTAFAKPYSWWIKEEFDSNLMQEAARNLEGFHDFKNFTDDNPEEKSTEVELKFIDLYQIDDLLVVHIVGSHFLWKMVRKIIGLLVEVGKGALSPTTISTILNGNNSTNSQTAPPIGLFLEKVYYQEDEIWRGAESFKLPILIER